MKVIRTEIEDVVFIEPKIFGDIRGFFTETYRKSWFDEAGVPSVFVQDNLSRSKKGTLRGLHYQFRNPQAKLVMVTRGEVLDVAVDIRKGSPTFGKHVKSVLSDANKRMIFIPEGFAHGFVVLSDEADFQYKCSDYYDPTSERAVYWNDPEIGIDWGMGDPILSDKDKSARLLKNVPDDELPVYTGPHNL
ncbi:dTDP-4-dehydrorhamnose 3,5-epimerase [Cyclonatronum proteinivorum]|uniref:dTDP-4-dehydrorhamnose 3,5-epimerase n=1 Tax=Cyclonatronum proteinivorum TaxID=1457365 RepID=A0A345UKM9_9BACT|nr:dTDP-4-dehydrorhamnose 3,5-epimerase [Cyclonatronum proteinivorum]AXJ01031.1 dTDP-4-dehydrorhamnose 3,5-epimerase [Cyclonatronum proteinivorum]